MGEDKIREQIKNLRWYGSYEDNPIKGFMCDAADTIESLYNKLKECDNSWVDCDFNNLPDKEVLCCDVCGEMIIGYIVGDVASEQTGFTAYNNHECMYNCVKWMEKPKVK